MYSWGNGGNFILGHGDQRSKLTPTRVSALDNVPVQAVAAGLFHSIAIAEDGDVYVWGEGKRHQFGQSYFPKPAQVTIQKYSVQNYSSSFIYIYIYIFSR